MKPSVIRRLLVALFVVTALSIGCREGGVTGPDRIPAGSGRLSVVAMFDLNTATNLVIEVTAPDIPQALVFNLDIVNGTATGSVTIPAGANRQITVRAFDGRTETHRGTRTVTIVEGVNPPLSLSLLPLAGTVPVTVSFGVAVVNVTPLVWSLPVDSVVVFSATVMDATGAMQTNPIVRWASTDTRKLTIDSLGRAMARDTGSVMVVAVSSGAAGRATVTVTPAEGVTPPSFTRTWVGGNGSGSDQTSWINPNNWSPAAVPTANDSVVIGAATFQPALPAVDTLQVRDLTLLPGANLAMNFRTLTVNGGSLASLGGTTNPSNPGTFRLLGNARLRGAVNAAVSVQGGGTVALADSARIPSLTVTGTSTVFDLAGHKLVLTSTGTALNVVTEGLLRMNNAADTLDVAGNVYLQASAAAHSGNLTAGTMIVRGSIVDGTRYEASGTHRTEFAGAVATVATQSVSGFDFLNRPANTLQDVVVRGTSAWSNCSPRLRVRGTFTVTGTVAAGTCTSYTLNVDGAVTTVAGSTLNPYGLVLGDTTGTAGVTGALGVEFLTFAAPNPQVRLGLAYRAVTFQRSVTIADSIRTTGLVTVDGPGSTLDIATPAGRAATFERLTLSNGAALSMTQASDSLIVPGTLTASSSADLSQTLTAGTLRIGGNLTGQTYGASGTHLTVLDGANATTWQDIGGMDANVRPTNVFRNLTIAHSGIGARSCFSNVRVTGAFRVIGTSTYSSCTSNFIRVDSLLATDAGTTVNAYGFTLANANGTQDVLGIWTPSFTDFTLPNQPVRASLGYQNVRFFASNTLPAGLSAATSLLVDGTTAVLALSDGRVTTAALTTQNGARFAMNAGDTLRVTGAVNLNGGQSAPSGGVLEIESSFNGTGYAPTGTHELQLRGASTHSLSGFNNRPVPTFRVVSGTAQLNFMNLIVQDSLLLATGATFNSVTSNFVTIRGRLQTASGSTMNPHGVVLEGTATLQLVDGGFAPAIVRVAGPGSGEGTVLRNAPGIQYQNVEFYASYTLSDSLMLTGSAYATGAGVVLDLNGHKLRAPSGLNFDANATGRMVNAADSLIVGNGVNATQALLWDSGTNGTVSAGTILVFGGSTTLSNFVGTGTNRVVFTDTAYALAARTATINGNATFSRLIVRGQSQFLLQNNFSTITVTDSLRIETGRLGLNGGTVVVDGAGQGVLAMGGGAVLNSISGGAVNLHSTTGTSLVESGATFGPSLTRFYASNPTVNPALDYQNVEFYAPVTFSGNTDIAGYLFAQNAGAGVTLGGHRVNVGSYADMGTSAFLVMSNAADTLDVTGDLAVDGGVNSTLTDGVVLFRGNTLTGSNYNAVAPHRTVFLGTTGAPQNVNGVTAFGRVEVAGGRGFNANSSTSTVADTFLVSTAVPVSGPFGGLTVNGPFRTTQPVALSLNTLRLRDTTGTALIATGSNITTGTIFLDHPTGTPMQLAPALTYVNLGIQSPVFLNGNVTAQGNVSVSGGATPSLWIGNHTLTVGGDFLNQGTLTMNDTTSRIVASGSVTFGNNTTSSTSLFAGTIQVGGTLSLSSVPTTANGIHTGAGFRYVLSRSDAATQAVQLKSDLRIRNLEIAGNGSRTIQFQNNAQLDGDLTVTSPATITINQNAGWTLEVGGQLSTTTNTTLTIPGTLLLTNGTGLSQVLGPATLTTLQYGGIQQSHILPTDTRYVITNFNLLSGTSATMAVSPSATFRIGSGTVGSLTVSGFLSIPPGNTLNVCGGLTWGANGQIDGGDGLPATINLGGTQSGTPNLQGIVTVNVNVPRTTTGC